MSRERERNEWRAALQREGRTSSETMLEWVFYALVGVGILTALAYAFF